MLTSTIRAAILLGIAALNATPALASGAMFTSARAAHANAMDETIYRPDCRTDDDFGNRNPCWTRGFGSRP
jgi:hypothetical protein